MERLFNRIPKEMYSSMVIHNPDPIFVLNKNVKLLDANFAASHLFGYKASEWADITFQRIISPESISDAVQLFAKAINGEICSNQVIAIDKKGKLLHLQVKSIPLYDEMQQFQYIMIVIKDLTDLIETRNALQKTEERFRFFYESSAEAMDIIDLDGNVVQVNKAFEKMYGWKEEEIVGTPMPTIPTERMEQVEKDRALVLNNESIKELEVECLKKDGTRITVCITLSPLHDEHGTVIAFSGISRDISERKMIQDALARSEEKYRLLAEELRRMAFHDELTGLPNRRLFQEIMCQKLKEAKRNQAKFVLLFMDIDKFKWVNDHFGHAVGDELLKWFSERVKQTLRECDVLARQSGDEFLVLLPDMDEDEAIAIVKRILDSFKEEWQMRGHSLKMTSSIGLAVFPQDGNDMETLLANADHALYKAKEKGRNTYMTYSD